MIRSRGLFVLLVVGMVMGVGTLGLAWSATAVRPAASAGADAGAGRTEQVGGSLSVVDSGSTSAWTARFDPGLVTGHRVSLQLKAIPTKMTRARNGQTLPVRNWVEKAAWQTVAIADPDASGVVTFRFDHPLGVEHTYRAEIDLGESQVVTNVVSYAAPRATKDTGLATIYLDTNDGSLIDSNEDAWEGRVSLAPDAAGTCAPVEPVRARLAGRGNSTWLFDKQPYNINLDKARSLCGMPAAKKWALLAEFYDRSLLRTTVAMHIGQGLSGLAWTPHTVPVDFYLNGEYQGLYTLIERIDIHENRLAIDQLKNEDEATTPPTDWNAEPTITGGYLLSWDYRRDTPYYFDVGARGSVSLEDPADGDKGTSVTPQQLAYIKDYLTAADAALFSPDFTDPSRGWRAYLDERSAVDAYLAYEFTKAVDGNMNASVYLYKTRDGADGPGKLHLGPLWDFDMSMGSSLYPDGQGLSKGWYVRDPLDPANDTRQVAVTWFNRLNADPGFRRAVAARWKELRPLFDGLPQYVDAQAARISKGAEVNFEEWDVTDQVEPEQVIKGSWTAEVAWLKTWLTARTAWLTSQLG